MLKIAEGISLDELEKYGFKYKPRGAEGWDFERFEKGNIFVSIDVRPREIINSGEDDTLYDLIQAGIVIKE